MVTRLALVCALLVSAATALAFPYMDGNTPERAHKGVVFDSLIVPHNRSRGIYLIDVPPGTVRSNMDSTLNLWFDGGAAPRFRRIQHLILWANFGLVSLTKPVFDITIYRDGATSQNRLSFEIYTAALDLPIEADSIRITSRTGAATNLELSYIIW